MPVTKFEIILYCKNQQISRDFYSKILNQPVSLDVQGMTEFQLTPEVKLGLMPESGIAKILNNKTPNPALANGIPRCELYIYVENPDISFKIAIQNGAKEVSKSEPRNWGDIVAYVSDIDGHIIAFAKKI